MLIKEFIQLRRDRVSFGMIVMLPLMQLILFGYAINTTPRNLPTAVLLQESSDVGRSILAALQNTRYFKITHQARDAAEFDRLLASGTVLFAIEIPANFERALRRGDRPSLLVAADATDPVAAGSALGGSARSSPRRCATITRSRKSTAPPFEVRTHARYNPAGLDRAQHRAGPGRHHPDDDHADLHCALGDARDRARHHGGAALDADHAGRDHARQDHSLRHRRLRAGRADHFASASRCSACRSSAALRCWRLSTLFITANLSIGYTFSTIAQNQLQAMQMSMMFFLPNILLSGFMFPFAGMPNWAQWIGEALPLTHFIRIVRAIMLKGSGLGDLHYDALALAGLTLFAMTIAVTRFRRTLD